MTDDMEDVLRRSLRARAADVDPDPETWRRISRRIDRARRLRLAGAGVALAGVVAIAAVAVPGLIDRNRVELTAPTATQPAAESPTASEAPATSQAPPSEPSTAGPGGIVFTDGDAVYVARLDGEPTQLLRADTGPCPPGTTRCDGIAEVTAAPDATPAVFSAVAATPENCGTLVRVAGSLGGPDGDGDLASSPIPSEQCATSFAFAPDGAGAAWLTQEPNMATTLVTARWEAAGPAGTPASFPLDLPYTDVRLEDWLWEDDSPSGATGWLLLTARTDNRFEAFRLPIERRADGALVPTGDAEPLGQATTGWVVASAAATTNPGGAQYQLHAIYDYPDGDRAQGVVTSLRLVRTPGEAGSQLELPAEMVGSELDPADLWIAAYGETVAYGDGGNLAFLATWTGDGFDVEPLERGRVVDADLLGSAPVEAATTAESRTTTVQVYFGEAGADDAESCASVRPHPRRVDGVAVARGALNELLAGPTPREEAAGAASLFSERTRDALRDVTIVDGVARVDFHDFRDELNAASSSCGSSALLAALDNTLLQFPTVERTVYSIRGNKGSFYAWLGSEAPED